jgi:hypothetical protein
MAAGLGLSLVLTLVEMMAENLAGLSVDMMAERKVDYLGCLTAD